LGTTPNDGIPREYVRVWNPRENSARIVDVAEGRESAEGCDFGESEGEGGDGKKACEEVGVDLGEDWHVGAFLD
jgi:hypothetical protein